MARARRSAAVLLALAALPAAPGSAGDPAGFALRSSAFAAQGEIPKRFTCEGEDVSPPLAWSEPPPGTRSFALIVSDPDAPDPRAPQTTWIHWVVYELPAPARALEAGSLPAGARSGRNDWGRTGYGGPCPPVGRHRYVHTVYALDVPLGDLGAPTGETLERAMQGHVLARAELVGTYAKHQP